MTTFKLLVSKSMDKTPVKRKKRKLKPITPALVAILVASKTRVQEHFQYFCNQARLTVLTYVSN